MNSLLPLLSFITVFVLGGGFALLTEYLDLRRAERAAAARPDNAELLTASAEARRQLIEAADALEAKTAELRTELARQS